MKSFLVSHIDTVHIIFLVSGIIIASLLCAKHRELKGHRSIVMSTCRSLDGIVHSWVVVGRILKRHIRTDSLAKFIGFLVAYVLYGLKKISVYLANKAHSNPQSKRVIDMVKGTNAERKEGASLFLKKIKQDRI